MVLSVEICAKEQKSNEPIFRMPDKTRCSVYNWIEVLGADQRSVARSVSPLAGWR